MKQYLFSVVEDELTRQRPGTELQPIFEAVDAFNQKPFQDEPPAA
ncbi:hypothetical protein [Jatrophihabitans telluris]|nr:hypothetical protein [Jatrophihabitans telluris]